MKSHDLKTWRPFFREVLTGVKTFEVRKNDRDFQVGDFLHLMEWDPGTSTYTGSSLSRRVVYVLHGGQFGIEPGFCVLGLAHT